VVGGNKKHIHTSKVQACDLKLFLCTFGGFIRKTGKMLFICKLYWKSAITHAV